MMSRGNTVKRNDQLIEMSQNEDNIVFFEFNFFNHISLKMPFTWVKLLPNAGLNAPI